MTRTGAVKRPCTKQTAAGPCPEYATRRGRCDEHQRKAWEGRGSRHERGYDADWDKARELQLKRHFWCQWPQCARPATNVDHIIPLAEGGARLDPRNHQSLCDEHRAIKDKADRLRGMRRRVR